MHWIARYGCLLFLYTICCCQSVLGCTGAAKEIAICLHTYLERDYMEVEPFLELREYESKSIFISGPEVDSLCHKFKTMVDCYTELDGQCYELQYRKRLSYLINALITFHQKMCDHDLKIKYLLEHIACIWRIQQSSRYCKVPRLVPNVWQRMLRLEATESSTCPSLQGKMTCLKETRLLAKHCGDSSQELFESSMQLWLDGWCPDYSSATKLSVWPTSLLVCVVLYQLLQ